MPTHLTDLGMVVSDRTIDDQAFTCRKTVVNEYLSTLFCFYYVKLKYTYGCCGNHVTRQLFLSKWNGKPRLPVGKVRHPPPKTPVAVLPWTRRSAGMTEQTDWRARQPSQAACVPEDRKC